MSSNYFWENDDWSHFLTWMSEEQGFTEAKDIIHIVDEPYKWQKEYEEYQHQKQKEIDSSRGVTTGSIR
jgi:hypothetical protein